MARRYRRKKVILHHHQVKLIVALLGLVVGISAILVSTLFLLFKNNASSLSIPEAHIHKILSDSIWPVVIIALILFAASIWSVIMMTHKIYGPLYRLNVYIKKLSEGEVTGELKFRKGDAIVGLKEVYNELRSSMEKTLRYDFKAMVTVFSDLQQILDTMYSRKAKQEELYDELQNACGRLAKALDMTSEAIESETE